jgi:hypothetical protein
VPIARRPASWGREEANVESVKDDQQKIWEAHERADGHWVEIDGYRHLWPIHSTVTACGLPVTPGETPPARADLTVCGQCSEATGSDLTAAEHITIVPPDAEP